MPDKPSINKSYLFSLHFAPLTDFIVTFPQLSLSVMLRETEDCGSRCDKMDSNDSWAAVKIEIDVAEELPLTSWGTGRDEQGQRGARFLSCHLAADTWCVVYIYMLVRGWLLVSVYES